MRFLGEFEIPEAEKTPNGVKQLNIQSWTSSTETSPATMCCLSKASWCLRLQLWAGLTAMQRSRHAMRGSLKHSCCELRNLLSLWTRKLGKYLQKKHRHNFWIFDVADCGCIVENLFPQRLPSHSPRPYGLLAYDMTELS